MSLKDAVSALRSLKAELEACRSSKAELEVAYRGVLNELRLAKEPKQKEGQDPSRSVGNNNDDDAPRRGDESGTAEVEREEWRETLEEEARCLREELAAVKARAELKSIRDTITAQPPSSPARTEGQEAVRPVASEDAVASALEKVNQLQEELESTVRDNVEMRRLIENTRQREEEENQHRLVQEGEAAANLAAMSSQLAESTEELEGLRERLKGVEQEEARIKASCSENVSALEASEGEVASLGASLAHTTEALEEAQQLAVTREEESSNAQRELAAAREELSSVAEKESNAAALAAEAEEGRAAAALTTTVVLERERAATSEALSRVTELETTLRETEAGRKSLLDAAASDAEKIEALAADVAKGLEEKEAAKEEARGAEARASTAEAKVSRVKSKVAALKETMVEAEKAHKVAVEKEVEARLGVEETLLMANKVMAERDSLRAELASEKEQASMRAAGLETQLADKEREAADTQRRLYLRQSELETELEDLNAHHDALRVELARMDASIENASDASFRRTPSSSATSMGGRGGGRLRAGGGSVASPKSTGRDPASIGAEVGGAVGGILRGKFWSGWGGGSVTSADTNGGGSTGEAGAGKGPAAAARKGSKARREGGRGYGEGKISTGAAGAGEADHQSISRVRENMMARLQEAAREGKVEQKETSGGAGGVKNKDVGGANTDNSGSQGASGENKEETGSDVKHVSDVGMAAAPRTVEDEWVEETVEHPPPDYGLESPVIRYLLQQWSTDPDKLKYLSLWLRCVIERRKVPDAFPSGLQLVGLAPEIKDGFLTLVIPMIRFTGGIPVLVHSRRSPPEESIPAGAGTPTSPDSHSKETALWDLRVKVDLNG
ncbi:conserved unknown protein [Ectocarpus siliculosus]|uniref:Uncharacterized protein n=1 Tax=Ectocarpus siliculosus TaxID=2880 RepID=D8LFB2_ECTSI|nr:conserved unknown protein [Ectocarpus siliculosus]|eukprot:CBN78837.1 conserved unknown protein [Ectocarpus siliculosus]